MPPIHFVGRARERAFLEELHGSGRPELFVLYGRRRVGKTELLQQFCQGHRSVYFLAAQVRDTAVRIYSECAAYALQRQLRRFSHLTLPLARFTDKVEISDEDIRTWYDSHLEGFMTPERVRQWIAWRMVLVR